jgi:hypothetical protein
VSLYAPAHVRDASHSFRAFSSGIANRWTVPYGARLVEFARTFLCASASGCRDASSPEDVEGEEVLVRLQGADYRVQGQAAHVTVRIDVVDATGSELLKKGYTARGGSGMSSVVWGGVFAQKEVTRSSTDEALREVFTAVVSDLTQSWRKRQVVPAATRPSTESKLGVALREAGPQSHLRNTRDVLTPPNAKLLLMTWRASMRRGAPWR